ncbi:MAG: nucleotide exchange factor GrpE [Planctomycetes bacterium]|nr:nucleotide exchange factor GrpE [Planctomycetota bacterium]
MNDEFKTLASAVESDAPTQGMSSIYRLFEAFIGLREKNERQHKLFEQTLNRARDSLQGSFNTFAADTQKAYQQLKQDVQGEKRFSLTLLNELLDFAIELDHILASRPALPISGPEADPWQRWLEALQIQNRKVQEALGKFGINAYDAVVGSPYNPALHERVGSKRVEGMDGLRVGEQIQRGYASQQPEFVLRRPKVLVTE